MFQKIIRARNECLEEPTPSTALVGSAEVRWIREKGLSPFLS